MATSLNTIKNWFKTGLKPTQAQFWATWDSFFHKGEKIPVSSVKDLETYLNEKAEKEAFNLHLTDEEAHDNLFWHYADPVDDLVDLAEIPVADLFNKQRRYVHAAANDYFYDAQAVEGDVAPLDQANGTGFWKKRSGLKGDKGDPLTVDEQGTLANRDNYDTEATGFSYFATDTSLLYFKTDTGWTAGVEFGKGEDGKEVEFQKTASYIQWRYVGGNWIDLVPLSELKGEPGEDAPIFSTTENQYGTHPAFQSQNEAIIWLLQNLGSGQSTSATKLNTPTNLTATPSNNSITLNWTDTNS